MASLGSHSWPDLERVRRETKWGDFLHFPMALSG